MVLERVFERFEKNLCQETKQKGYIAVFFLLFLLKILVIPDTKSGGGEENNTNYFFFPVPILIKKLCSTFVPILVKTLFHIG